MNKHLTLLYLFFSASINSCASGSGDSTLSQEEANPQTLQYSLGVQKGKLDEKAVNYRKALKVLSDQKAAIEENFQEMSAQEIYALQKIEQTLTTQMKILDVSPMQDTITKINNVKLNLDKSVQVIKMIEGLEPVMLEYIETVAVLGVVHKEFFSFFTEIGGVIPFVSLYARLIDQMAKDFANMQMTIANSVLYESVADYTVDGEELDVTSNKIGFLKTYPEYNHYWEYWSNVEQGRQLLTEITGDAPPFIEWNCRVFCTRSVENTKNGSVKKFESYLKKNSQKIYLAIDELRISRGPASFPIFYGPRTWRTEVGGSRAWRKPQILAKLNQQIKYLEVLLKTSTTVAESIEFIAITMQKKPAE